MRSFKYPLTSFIKRGLALNNNSRNNPMLIQSVGAIPYEKQLQAIEQFTAIDVSSILNISHPFPQVFITSDFILICSIAAIFEYDGSSLTLKAAGVQAWGLWSVLDFKTYIYITNGAIALTRDPDTGIYSQITPSETLTYASCVCNFNGQILMGSPEGGPQASSSIIDISVPQNVTLYSIYGNSNEVSLAISALNGGSWTTSTIVTNQVPDLSLTYQYSSIATYRTASDDYLWVSYRVTGSDGWARLEVSNSSDSGASFSRVIVDQESAQNIGDYTSLAAASATDVYISYAASNPSDRLKFAVSNDGGATWITSTLNVSSTNNFTKSTSIATPYVGYIYLVYGFRQTSPSQNQSLNFMSSSDGGSTWTSSTVLDSNAGTDTVGWLNGMSIYGQYIIYIIYENKVGTDTVKVIKSTNGGSTWETPVTVDSLTVTSVSRDVIDANTVIVAYTDTETVYFSKTTDGGTTWSTPVVVDTPDSLSCCIRAEDKYNFYITFNNSTAANTLYYSKTTDGGSNWSTAVSIDGGFGISTSNTLSTEVNT